VRELGRAVDEVHSTSSACLFFKISLEK